MISDFGEAFLRSQNHDCLGQVLSFLSCNDLANVARTCKALQHTIFEADHQEVDVNLIWHGAEEALTKPWDRKRVFVNRTKRTGSNAREHCHLFALASKAAKACELSDEKEENRIMVDGVLADLMNVRGYDAEGIAEKKAIGAKDIRTLEEAFHDIDITSMIAEESEEFAKLEKHLQRKEEWKKLSKLSAPTKTYHHEVFVRITRTATGEMLSEGFCGSCQKYPWCTGLDFSRDSSYFAGDAYAPITSQGLQLILDFESLKQSEEIQNFLSTLSGTTQDIFDSMSEGLGINLTSVVIDRRNRGIQCLLQQDPARNQALCSVGRGFGAFQNFKRFNFGKLPRWGSDSIRLGASVSKDLYYLSFSLSLCVSREKMDGSLLLVPMLEVNVKEDRSAVHQAMIRLIQAQMQA